MKMTQVTSSNINAIGYNKDANELFVEFKNGKTFCYKDVSRSEAADLFNAESVGKHFNQFIKAVKVGGELVAFVEVELTDKEKIELLRKALHSSTDRLNAVWHNTGSMGAKEQADINVEALEATK